MKVRRVEGSRILPKMDTSHIKMCKAGSTFVATFNKLFFAGFPSDVEEEDLFNVLSTFGRLRAFVLATDKQTNRSRGFGHCEFETDLETESCLKRLNGVNIEGKTVTIRRAALVSAH